MTTYRIGDRLDRTKLGATLVEPSELFALKWGGKWAPAYRGGWSTNPDGSGPVNFQAINIGNEAEVYPTQVGLTAFPSMNDVMKSDGPNGPLRITPRRMTTTEAKQVNTRPQLSSQTWLSGAPTSLVDIVLPYYAEIKCDIPVKPDGTYTALWPAFWQQLWDMNWNVGTGGPEFDIMEMFGRDNTPRITTGYHAPSGAAWSSVDGNGKLIGGSLKALIDTGAISGAIEYIGTGTASQNMGVGTGVHTFGGWADASGFYTFVDDVCKWIWPVDPAAVNRKINVTANLAIGTGDTSAGNIGPNETSVGTWTIYDMRVSAIGGAPTPPPVVTPPAPPADPTKAALLAQLKTAADALSALGVGISGLPTSSVLKATVIADVLALAADYKAMMALIKVNFSAKNTQTAIVKVDADLKKLTADANAL